ncbi:MAG: hypothetical protein ABF968_12575 [Acetobacter sp.]|uniref:hypothetical protein n=1 Tax=unclassified Acetobacter TaxID=2628570 RepID=UPI0025C22E1B|nr:hypothetical protein [Acetobacter sp. UBA5411]
MTELLIVFVVSDGVRLMDIAGPADVFAFMAGLFTGLSLQHERRISGVLAVSA